VLGVILGVVIGITGLLGMFGIGAYFLVSSAICYVYILRFLGVDEDTMNAGEVVKEHFAPGFFSFMLFWVITYNLVKF
jgi:hypothetical protein